VNESVPVGRFAVDGKRLVPLAGVVMAARRQMLRDGVVVASLAVDQAGRLRGRAQISAPGLLAPDDEEMLAVADDFAATLADLSPALRQDETGLVDAARAALRRVLGRRLQKRPQVEIHVLRV
jgi:ribonuclease J